mgnify:FL=1
MTEDDIKNLMYGSIRELTKTRTYYYNGYRSHFTDEGKRVISEMMDLYAEKISKAIEEADEARAKDMVFKTLKGEEEK